MTATERARFWRAGIVLPAVVLAVLASVAALANSRQAAPAERQASYQDGSPLGHLGYAAIVPGGLRVRGWDFDPSSPKTALTTVARVDGRRIPLPGVSNIYRNDVAAAFPAATGYHGFRWLVPVPQGRHTVCIVARNIGRGHNTALGCRTENFNYGPIGRVSSVTASNGALHVAGWTLDNDSPSTSLNVIISIDGQQHTVLADQNRPGIAATHPGAGAAHGFNASFPASQGSHTVCVTGVNIGLGSNDVLGCSTVVLDDSPTGVLNSVSERRGELFARGWAYDPDASTSPISVSISVDGAAPETTLADVNRPDVARSYPSAGADHGFAVLLPAAEGTHTVCVTALNVGLGHDVRLGCRSFDLDFTPQAAITSLTQAPTGLTVSGWAFDPDTSAPITVRVSTDGGAPQTITANRQGAAGSVYAGRQYSDFVPLTSGTHRVCVVAVNVLYGTHNSTPACRRITLALSPIGSFTSIARVPNSNNLSVTGWAFDPDTSSPISIAVTLDDASDGTVLANAVNPASAAAYPRFGDQHGFAATITTNDGEHTVCLTAQNVSGGQNVALGCKLIIAVHPVAPSSPQAAQAIAGYGGAAVTWSAPTSDGGAPVSSYTVTASPGGQSATVNGTTLSAAVLGLNSKTAYTFTVTATNLAGTSTGTTSASVTTTAGPPAQRTPAPISTSRYMRNADDASPSELATMRSEGVADANANPSGHGYLVLLDIGGQDQADGGVVLSGGVRFVSYGDLVQDIDAYVDGYHSAQASSAPVTIALGTNNDMTVNAASGAAWARSVVNPVRSHVSGYINMTIAGADDIEPGFRATYSQSKAWLGGFLGATPAPFVFNGSADGCSWTTTNSRCNNGWTMAGLQYLAGGAAPTRILALPQIYNNAMAGQWKYISLTGVVNGGARINFAGPLTELTACQQAGSCGSLAGHAAWTALWNELQSDSRLAVSSLPYSTDLRIDG